MNPILIATALVVGAVVVRRARRLRRALQWRDAVVENLPDTVEMLVVLVRSGLAPAQAADLLAARAPDPWRQAFAEVRRRRHNGERLSDALEALPEQLGVAGQQVLDALRAADRYGQPLLPSLERLSSEGRAARQRHHEQQARRLPVRLSVPLVCCTLPAFLLLAIVPLIGGTLLSMTPLRGTQ